MYRNITITQDMLSEFCENVHNDLIKLKEDSKLKNEMISKINEHITAIDLKIETNKILINEKNENIIFRLSVLNDKMKDLEQKMNDLNKIMMKHFAYKKSVEIIPPTQTTAPPLSTTILPPLNGSIQNIKPTGPPNPFSFNTQPTTVINN